MHIMSFLKRFDEALDKAFAPKVDKFQVLEDKIVKNTTDLITCSLKTFEFIAKDVQNVKEQVNSLILAIKETKETIDATKARLEKLEVYTNMKRVVDPSKPARERSFTDI